MILLTLILLTLLCLAVVAADTPSTDDGDLRNFAQVTDGFYRGAAPTLEGLHRLKSMGVTTIIDLRTVADQIAQERSDAESLGLRFVNLPMETDPPPGEHVEAFLAAAKEAAAQPVFVHCQYGCDRTGCMVGIYRVVHERWSYDRAYEEMRSYGFTPEYTKLSDSVRERCAE